MTQRTIDFEAKARAFDPQMSHDAAASTEVSRSHDTVLTYLKTQAAPLTSEQIVDALKGHCSPGRVRGALVELCRVGLVRIPGISLSRCGRKCSLYEATR